MIFITAEKGEVLSKELRSIYLTDYHARLVKFPRSAELQITIKSLGLNRIRCTFQFKNQHIVSVTIESIVIRRILEL